MTPNDDETCLITDPVAYAELMDALTRSRDPDERQRLSDAASKLIVRRADHPLGQADEYLVYGLRTPTQD